MQLGVFKNKVSIMKSCATLLLAFILVACSKQTYIVGEILLYKDNKVVASDFTSCRKNSLCTIPKMLKLNHIGKYACDLEGVAYLKINNSLLIKQPSISCKVTAYEASKEKLPI